jgi:hypothetical protein
MAGFKESPPKSGPASGCLRSLQKMFVESEDRNGKPIVWYSLDSKGRKQKQVRDANGVSIAH